MLLHMNKQLFRRVPNDWNALIAFIRVTIAAEWLSKY